MTSRAPPQPPPQRRLLSWAFATLTSGPGARTFYDQRRPKGDTYCRVVRALANRLVASSTARRGLSVPVSNVTLPPA